MVPPSSIWLERYRAFARRATLDLRPLTVVYGYNSAGKSAMVRALPLLAASCEERSQQSMPLDLEHPSVFGAHFDELRTQGSLPASIVFGLSWPDGFSAQLTLKGVSHGIHAIDKAEWQGTNGQKVVLSRSPTDEDEQTYEDAAGTSYRLPWLGLVPQGLSGQTELLGELPQRLRSLGGVVDWLAAVRARPPRRNPLKKLQSLSWDGSDLVDVLAHPDRSDLLHAVNVLSQRVTGYSVLPREDSAEYRLEVELSAKPGFLRNILDVGEGITQVLPVLVQLARFYTQPKRAPFAIDGRMIVIEQPEIHLHPKAEVELARVLVEAVAKARHLARRPLLVVETHSDVLLATIQLAMLEGTLTREDVALHWLYAEEPGDTRVQQLEVDEQGRIVPDWPAHVFSEAIELSRSVVLKRREVEVANRGRGSAR